MAGVRDFANEKTWQTLTEKVGPLLYEAARCEFETIIGGGDAREEDLGDIQGQGELLKGFVNAYIDGLVKMFQEYVRGFYECKSESEAAI